MIRRDGGERWLVEVQRAGPRSRRLGVVATEPELARRLYHALREAPALVELVHVTLDDVGRETSRSVLATRDGRDRKS